MSKYKKSASIILQRTTGEVYMCKRADSLKFFPGFWVFPGGKIDEPLNDDWLGTEFEVYETIFKELYEETGIVVGSPNVFPPNKRKQNYLVLNYNESQREEFKDKMVYIGKKRTPPFSPLLYDAAYFWIQDPIVDKLHPQVDNGELVEEMWIQPEQAIQEWKEGKRMLPPPILHLLRNMQSPHFVDKTLIETDLPFGLSTKIEISPGFQAIPYYSPTIPPFSTTNLVIIEYGEKLLLVDPGAKEEKYGELEQLLQTLPTIPDVVITHHHKDHWNALKVVEELFPEAKLFAHPLTTERINTKLNIEPFDFPHDFGGGLVLIHTPGHTDGHISIHCQGKNLLVAGDHVVGYGSAVLDPVFGDMSQYMETTRKLLDLAPKVIIPAHGPPNFNGIQLLQQYLEHRQAREDAILASFNAGNQTLDELVKTVYQDVPQDMWEYAKRNIELVLDKLKKDGKIKA